ncbi:hypothetical protein O181_001862 [Austropuccinia psidii MF-1]|uniref:Uncharacterized protein n=1 Tax=Austropuccinia psidii MF-1 TaxID=1389203 RepID=A0A9Q3GDG8_9BASI|nr:hypothetical protein [Austropuccinia psidii MF-1]
MLHIKELESVLEVAHVDLVEALSPSGDKRYNSFLGSLDRYRKTPLFLPCNKDETSVDTALLLWNRVLSHIWLFKNIIGYIDSKLTSAL